MNAALLVAAGSLGLFAVALILLCRAAEAADKNRADDLLGPVLDERYDDVDLRSDWDRWQVEVWGQR